VILKKPVQMHEQKEILGHEDIISRCSSLLMNVMMEVDVVVARQGSV
jgi:hypothetical protein